MVRSCLSNVQHLEDMSFSLSNTKTNGQEFIKIELLIPRNSLGDCNRVIEKHGKNNEVKLTVNTSNTSSQNQRKNSASQYSDQSTSSNPRKKFHVKLPSNEKIQIHTMERKSLYSNLPEKRCSSKRKLEEGEIESSSLCGVCGDKATKFIHYGGRGCQSCRAFFRRTVEKCNM